MNDRTQVERIRDIFVLDIRSAKSYTDIVSDALKLLKREGTNRQYIEQRNLSYELAFLKIVARWQAFIEDTMVLYLRGITTSEGYGAKAKSVYARDAKEAYQMLSGNKNFSHDKNYLQLSNVDSICNTANKVFTFHSYKKIKSYSNYLEYASFIRNRIAHDSQKCKKNFNIASDFFQKNKELRKKQKKGHTPGELLTFEMSHDIDSKYFRKGEKIFDIYCNFFHDLSNMIVPIG